MRCASENSAGATPNQDYFGHGIDIAKKPHGLPNHSIEGLSLFERGMQVDSS